MIKSKITLELIHLCQAKLEDRVIQNADQKILAADLETIIKIYKNAIELHELIKYYEKTEETEYIKIDDLWEQVNNLNKMLGVDKITK
jgi:hypothetical protein